MASKIDLYENWFTHENFLFESLLLLVYSFVRHQVSYSYQSD